MDVSTSSLRSTGSTGKPRAGRQLSNVSTKSQGSTPGSPRMMRKSPVPTAANGKTATPRSKLNGASTPGRNEKLDMLRPATQERKSSATSVKSKTEKIDVGNRRPEKKPSGTVTATAPKTPVKSTELRKTSTPKESVVKRATRDINRNSPREKPIRSDSSDLETASKLVGAKIYELRTELVNNSLITATLKEFVKGGVESFVVLPLGRFSRHSPSLWRAAMMEVLLEITVPRRRIYLDPGLIELEKESLRSHAFLHAKDKLPDEIVMKDSVRAPGITLVYAPLPDFESIEKLLKENEDKLEQILVIGYSLHKLAKKAPASSILRKHLNSIQEETFPFGRFPQSAFAPVFSGSRGHRFTVMPKSSSRYSDMRASSCFLMADGFIPVRSKRMGRKTRNGPAGNTRSVSDIDEAHVRDRLDSAKRDLSCSEYWETLKKALRVESVPNIVCLGLGQFSDNLTARWQTALMMLLKEELKTERTVVYDPLFNRGERKLLSEMGCEIPPENDEGFLIFSDSLFYMPHCGKPLFNSVVYANRKHLTSVTIFGNSFSAMFDQFDFQNRIKNGELAALKGIEALYDEVPVENIFQYKDVFNDFSIVRFRSELLEEIPRPVYSSDDEIILREAIQSLSINDG
ncbi:uncharacterized protein LOC100907622 [Galendromus occidentalis]|uniref:Uncharacterized protein LOC100907622 n=1 Tax=Galendromus occidentalis TaxID=34638 RepID=A0AAJ7PAM3_9ACAR|nr:uncharacterized protein LOC100907622 [Galendromus occidentalis]